MYLPVTPCDTSIILTHTCTVDRREEKRIAQAKLYYTYVRSLTAICTPKKGKSGVFFAAKPNQKRLSSTNIVEPIVVLMNAIKRV